MKHSCWTFLFTLLGGAWLAAAPLAVNGPVVCEGYYPQHLQGTASNGKDAFYWSWTVALVKTDLQGKILKSIPVATHHGDLCFHDGRVYVAVNLGKFNEPPGQEDSWVYVYDGDSLKELARHRVPELVHGAGGMAWRGGKFFVVGGLPPDGKENYIYEYDEKFIFQKRHVLASGYTYKGIQTIEFANGEWWFGCYGTPKVTLRADEKFQFKAKYEFDASLGIIGLADGRFLIGANVNTKGRGYQGTLLLARPDREKGLVRLN